MSALPPTEKPVARVVTAHAVSMQLDGVLGGTLFPSLQQGPWWPIERFAESTVDPRSATRDPHPHEREEVVNYVLAGELAHADGTGATTPLHEGSVSVLTAVRSISHDLYPTGDRPARWISLVVHLADREAGTPAPFRLTNAPPVDTIAPGVTRKRLVGPGTEVDTVSALELSDVDVAAAASVQLDMDALRRLVVYVRDGTGTVLGTPVQPGTGLLTEGLRRVPVESAKGMNLILATIPAP